MSYCTGIPDDLQIHTAAGEPSSDPTVGIDVPTPTDAEPMHLLVTIGDSLTHGFMFAARPGAVDVPWPRILAVDTLISDPPAAVSPPEPARLAG